MKRMAALFILAAAFLAPMFAQAADAKTAAAQWVAYGNKQYQAKQFDAAIKSFNNAIKYDRTNAGAYQGIAYAYYYKGDKVNYGKYMQWANYYKRQGGAAATAAAPAAESAASYMARGRQYMGAKQYAYAAWAYNKATQLEPGNAGAWQGLGYSYVYQGNKAQAIQCLDRSLALQPNAQLQAYVNQLKGGSAQAAAEPEEKQAPWVPYVMGTVVVVLGAVMIFLF